MTINSINLAGNSADDPSDDLEAEPAEAPLQLIPVVSTTTADGRPTLRLLDPRSAAKTAIELGDLKGVDLDPDTLRRLLMSCVEPDGFRVTRHRVGTGWLSIIETRQFVTLFTLTPSNDRLGDQLIYAADPSFDVKTVKTDGRRIGHIAVPMPESDGTYAKLVYTATRDTLMEATDRNCQAVRKNNPQHDIGPDIIHRSLTTVFTTLHYTGGSNELEQVSVDGNSRLASAYAQIKIDPRWLPQRLRKQYEDERPMLSPSILMDCDLTERRDLTRKIIKANEDRLALPVGKSLKDLRERNAAVCTLNALTAPVQVIVGYEDDDAQTHGMTRFASAVRSLLVRMNVGVKTFDTGAQNAVMAEEVVLAAQQSGHFDEDEVELLIGREDVSAVMEAYGLDPALRDLRAMMVISLCSVNSTKLNKAMREKFGKRKVMLSHRSAVASELVLRSYGAVMSSNDLERSRRSARHGRPGHRWRADQPQGLQREGSRRPHRPVERREHRRQADDLPLGPADAGREHQAEPRRSPAARDPGSRRDDGHRDLRRRDGLSNRAGRPFAPCGTHRGTGQRREDRGLRGGERLQRAVPQGPAGRRSVPELPGDPQPESVSGAPALSPDRRADQEA
ncbi:hypothetical protein [Streptomyces xylophagus]|uniref:hypothetical protein n=1 Tax=Streptomyces xylophagus TaxID=285514 RepID=UPI00131BE17D|nr:hypothetical protein [Streptomyces xylophagus]